jgi:hypothetical protein
MNKEKSLNTHQTVVTPAAFPQEPPPDQSQQPMINIVDIQNAVKVIDYAAEQGAFKGWNIIEQVQNLRNKLSEFVVAVTPKTDAPKKKRASRKTN